MKSEDSLVMADWVNSLAPWSVFVTLTFRWESSIDAAVRAFERFMARECRDVSYFFAVERNPSRDGFHVHAIWADCHHLSRKSMWQRWFDRFGRGRIEPIRGLGDVTDYCSKYVTKEGSWWNFKLVQPTLWHAATV